MAMPPKDGRALLQRPRTRGSISSTHMIQTSAQSATLDTTLHHPSSLPLTPYISLYLSLTPLRLLISENLNTSTSTHTLAPQSLSLGNLRQPPSSSTGQQPLALRSTAPCSATYFSVLSPSNPTAVQPPAPQPLEEKPIEQKPLAQHSLPRFPQCSLLLSSQSLSRPSLNWNCPSLKAQHPIAQPMSIKREIPSSSVRRGGDMEAGNPCFRES